MKSRCKSKGCRNKASKEGFCNDHRMQRLSYRYKDMVKKAQNRGVAVEIKKVEYESLISGKMCYYCEGPLNPRGSGLDRLDSQLGYEIGNVVPCCSYCNNLKGAYLTPEETLKVISTLKKVRRLKKNVWKNHTKNHGGLGHGISKRKRR
jgi:hypothetical protein